MVLIFNEKYFFIENCQTVCHPNKRWKVFSRSKETGNNSGCKTWVKVSGIYELLIIWLVLLIHDKKQKCCLIETAFYMTYLVMILFIFPDRRDLQGV